MKAWAQVFSRKETSAATFADELLGQDTWKPSTQGAGTAINVRAAELPAAAEGFLLPEAERPVCAARGCDAQPKFWKKSGRPVFEGMWACSRACARKLVEGAVRRQMASASAFAGAATHRHRIPLGLVLLDQGLVTQFQLRQALDAQREAGHGRIGHWLGETCGVEQEKITRALAAQWNRPVLSSGGFHAETMACVMPGNLRRGMAVLPLRVAAGKILYVAFAERVDHTATAVLERMSGLRVESGLLSQDEFAQAESRLEFATPVPCREEQVSDTADLVEGVLDALWSEEPVASRLVAVHGAWWLRLWLERGAVGAHGTLPATGEDVVDVMFRR